LTLSTKLFVHLSSFKHCGRLSSPLLPASPSRLNNSERAYVSDLIPVSLRDSSLGLYNGAIGIAAILSSLAAGALWAWWGAEATFIFGSGSAALATVGLLGMKSTERSGNDLNKCEA